jgi:uncharacterized protein (TIGR00369 family)
MDEAAARAAFETALSEHVPDFETFFLAKLMGLTFEYPDERCVIRFPVRDFLFNPQGSLHGGIIATIMDISMGHLLKRTLGVQGATLEMKVQFLEPVRPPAARCEGRFLRKGNSICFLESRLWNADDALSAVATATWKPATRRA